MTNTPGQCGVHGILQLHSVSKTKQRRGSGVWRVVLDLLDQLVLLLDHHLAHLLPHADILRGLLETLWSSMCWEERKLSRNMESVLSFCIAACKIFSCEYIHIISYLFTDVLWEYCRWQLQVFLGLSFPTNQYQYVADFCFNALNVLFSSVLGGFQQLISFHILDTWHIWFPDLVLPVTSAHVSFKAYWGYFFTTFCSVHSTRNPAP